MCWWSADSYNYKSSEGLCFAVSLRHLTLNILLRICSKNPDFDLAGHRLETSFAGRSLMHPLIPLPRSSTPPSLFPAAEAFDNVPSAFEDVPSGTALSEA